MPEQRLQAGFVHGFMDAARKATVMDAEQAHLSIEEFMGVLRRRAPWILFCFVLVAGAAFGFSKHETKKYTATASLVQQ